MIKLVAKCGLIVEFKMASLDAERLLVHRFYCGFEKDEQTLKLGKHGKILVKDIYAISVLEPEVAKPKEQPFNVNDFLKWQNK